jgi:membrane associated rhomboid family serine protease/Zn-finger nucleic acid-binding protein
VCGLVRAGLLDGVTRGHGEAIVRCPQCKQVMKVVEEKAFSALLCQSCGGMFYPEEEFGKHLETVTKLLPPQQTEQELMPGRPPWGLSVGEAHRPCPGCGGPLRPFNYAYHSNIILANCPACHGIWVEPGQMLRVARYRARHPGVEHLVEGIAKKRKKSQEPAGYDDDLDSQMPRFNPLGCLFTFLPVSNAPQLSRTPVVMWILIAMNAAAFAIAGRTYGLENWAIVPTEVTAGRDLQTYLTYQFAHGDIWHLLGNMLFLRAFGDRVEDRLGPIAFLFSYLALGVVAALAQVYMFPESTRPCVGASGAVMGVLGVYLLLFPWSSIRMTLLFITIPVPAVVFIGVYMGWQLGMPTSGHIAVAAHLGGFFAGAWLGGLLRILRLSARRRAEA